MKRTGGHSGGHQGAVQLLEDEEAMEEWWARRQGHEKVWEQSKKDCLGFSIH